MLGAKLPKRYCRRHERRYLEDDHASVMSGLNYVARNIRYEPTLGCWEFQRLTDFNKRGQVYCAELSWLPHRFMYIWFYGGHNGGLELDHYCNNNTCVNPAHLRPVSPTVNKRLHRIRSTDPLGRMHMPQGPPIPTELRNWATSRGLLLCPALELGDAIDPLYAHMLVGL